MLPCPAERGHRDEPLVRVRDHVIGAQRQFPERVLHDHQVPARRREPLLVSMWCRIKPGKQFGLAPSSKVDAPQLMARLVVGIGPETIVSIGSIRTDLLIDQVASGRIEHGRPEPFDLHQVVQTKLPRLSCAGGTACQCNNQAGRKQVPHACEQLARHQRHSFCVW